MVGEQMTEIPWDHPWSAPSPPIPLSDDAHSSFSFKPPPPVPPPSLTAIPLDAEPGGSSSHHPHYCYVPGLDFLFIHIFTFGLDQDGYWQYRVRISSLWKLVSVQLMCSSRKTDTRLTDTKIGWNGMGEA